MKGEGSWKEGRVTSAKGGFTGGKAKQQARRLETFFKGSLNLGYPKRGVRMGDARTVNNAVAIVTEARKPAGQELNKTAKKK